MADERTALAAALDLEEFTTASHELLAAWQSGNYTEEETLRIIAELHTLDPVQPANDGFTADSLVKRFEALTPGTPVLRLGIDDYDFSGNVTSATITGIITKPVNHFEVIPPTKSYTTPHAIFRVPIAEWDPFGINGERRFSVHSSDLALRRGAIGRQAIANLVAEMTFTPGRPRNDPASNMDQILQLSTEIQRLHSLGMEPIDTENLRKQLERAYDLRGLI